jgi:hypothetical protein
MIKYLFGIVFLLMISCTAETRSPKVYLYNHFWDYKENLSKGDFDKLIAENTQEVLSDKGNYFPLYDVIEIPTNYKTTSKLINEEALLKRLFIKKNDSLVVANLIQNLINLKGKSNIMPSVYPKIYNSLFNSKQWVFYMKHSRQQALRDTTDKYLNQLSSLSKFRLKTTDYSIYNRTMRLKNEKLNGVVRLFIF